MDAVGFRPDGSACVTASKQFGRMALLPQNAQLWRVPGVLAVNVAAERVALWIEVRKGKYLDAEGRVRLLDPPSWDARRRRLRDLGGPPVPEWSGRR